MRAKFPVAESQSHLAHAIVVKMTIVLFLLAGCAQEVEQDRAKGRIVRGERSGAWTGYYFGGQKHWSGKYRKGKATGTWTWWHENGNLKERSVWEDSLRHGKIKTWYESGQLEKEGQFEMGLQQGDWTWWHDDGMKAGDGSFDHGARVGVFRTWHQDGSLESRSHWTAEGDAEVEAYYPDGTLHYHGQWKAGKQDGLWVFYDEQGRLFRQELYREGVLLKGG